MNKPFIIKSGPGYAVIRLPIKRTVSYLIRGTADLVMPHPSWYVNKEKINKIKKYTIKEMFEQSRLKSGKGWDGLSANAFLSSFVFVSKTHYPWDHSLRFRNGCKLPIYINEDGFDTLRHIPIVKITKGKAICVRYSFLMPNTTYARVVYRKGWEAIIMFKFDPDLCTVRNVHKLLSDAGKYIGIGEGRPGATHNSGRYGTFKIVSRINTKECVL